MDPSSGTDVSLFALIHVDWAAVTSAIVSPSFELDRSALAALVAST